MAHLASGGALLGSAFGLAASLHAFSLSDPENVAAHRAIGSPLPFVAGLLAIPSPPAANLYYIIAAQWALVGWLARYAPARRRPAGPSAPGTRRGVAADALHA